MKGNKIKCLISSVIFILLFIVSLCFPTYAAEYGKQYPAYLKQSAGCFIECQTNLGKGSIVLPRNYQYEYIGFSGSGSNIMNLQSSSISGQFVLENGTSYDVRASGFSTFQYYSNSGNWGSYYDLTVSSIYNTNVQFTDEQSDRGNVIYNFSNYQKFVVVLLSLSFCVMFVFGIRSCIKNV